VPGVHLEVAPYPLSPASSSFSISVEFHMSRGDFEKWIRSLGDDALARNLAKLRKKGLGGEDLRARLRDTVGKRLGRR
jgi:hypothetical protein